MLKNAVDSLWAGYECNDEHSCGAGRTGEQKWVPRSPYALGIVALATLISWLAGFEGRGVTVIGTMPAGLPTFAAPPLDWDSFRALLPTAVTIAFVGYLTMISIAKSFADKNRYDISPNRELFAAGSANLLAGFGQGFPVSASFSRSAVHSAAGSTSPYTLLITAAWVGLTLLFLTGLLHHLPKATLAAIIITAVYGLIDVKKVKRLYAVKRADMWLLVLTFAATLGIGIEPGILIGVGASLIVFIVRTTNPHTAVLGRLPGTSDFRNVKNHPSARTYPGLIIIRIDAQFYFGNVTFLKALLNRLERAASEPVNAIVLEACSLNQLDSSAADALDAIVDDYEARSIQFMIASVKVPVLNVMKASGLYAKLGDKRFFLNVDDAVKTWLASRETSDISRD